MSNKTVIRTLFLSMLILAMSFMSVLGANGQMTSVSISSTDTSAKSSLAIWNCQGNLELSGANSSSSTNSLYVQCYEQRNSSLDRKEKEFMLSIGQDSSVGWALSAYNAGKAYYVKLNPKGALSTGCSGNGTLYD